MLTITIQILKLRHKTHKNADRIIVQAEKDISVWLIEEWRRMGKQNDYKIISVKEDV